MSKKKIPDATQRYERALEEAGDEEYLLRLYISGATPASDRAIANLKAVCEEHLEGRYQLEVIDIFQQPDKAATDQIVALPTLLKLLPLPTRRFIGDLSGLEDKLVGVEILPRGDAAKPC